MRRLSCAFERRLLAGCWGSAATTTPTTAFTVSLAPSTTAAVRHQSRARPEVNINISAADTSSSALSPADAAIKASLAIATPSTFALATTCGIVHDVQVGQVGEDMVLQFTLVTNVLLPTAADSALSGTASAEGSGTADGQTTAGGISSFSNTLGGRIGAATTSAAATRGIGSAASSSLRSATAAASGSGRLTAAGASGGVGGGRGAAATPVVDSDHDVAGRIAASTAEALPRQPHISAATSKEQITVRCFGGEDELQSLQSRIGSGEFARVEGNFKINKQKDMSASSSSGGAASGGPASRRAPSAAAYAAANGLSTTPPTTGPFAGTQERCFPYIRVELGDARAYQRAAAHVASVESTPSQAADDSARRSWMAPVKGSHSLVRTGNVTLIARATNPPPASPSSK